MEANSRRAWKQARMNELPRLSAASRSEPAIDASSRNTPHRNRAVTGFHVDIATQNLI